ARAAVVDQQDRGPARELDDLGLEGRILFTHPRPQELGRLGDGAPFGPVGVVGGREARNAGVLAQGREDALLPGGVDGRAQARARRHGSVIWVSVIRARRPSDLVMLSAVCWPIFPALRKKACLS